MRQFLLLIACTLTAACGQTGPLYLPDEGVTTPVEIRESRPPAAAEEAPAEAPEEALEAEADASAAAGPEA
jgi:predicted small lipoprotein YifL